MDAELLEAEKRNRNRVCHVTKYQRDLLGQAVAALVWVIANDASIIGILDDALAAPLCTYLATRAPAIFQ